MQAVVLGIKAMAGSAMDPRVFGFIDPPPPDRLEAAMTNLKQVRPLTFAGGRFTVGERHRNMVVNTDRCRAAGYLVNSLMRAGKREERHPRPAAANALV